MTTKTLACMSHLTGFHNGGKYQMKSPDESKNLRQKLSLCFKRYLEDKTSYHITIVNYASFYGYTGYSGYAGYSG